MAIAEHVDALEFKPRWKDAVPDPPRGSLTGMAIGMLIRVSTVKQIGNWSTVNQEESLARFIVQEGGTVLPYDEQGVSGRRLSKRQVARRLLEDIKAGRMQGIGAADIKRLTRDEFGADAGVIAQILVKGRAVLVTPGRIYRLWNKDDLTSYRIETAIAGRDVLDVRDTFWRGVFGRAEHEPFFMNKPPFGYTTDLEEVTIGARVKVKRIPKKDPARAGAMADLARWLDECTSLGDVASRMNKAGHLNPVRRGSFKGAMTIWSTWKLRWLIERPIYRGDWLFGHSVDRNNPVWDIDQRRERVRSVAVPHLAYWTPAQALNWRKKFAPVNGRAPVRKRVYDRPLVGVLACCGCGEPMIAAGRTGYQCPTKAQLRRICPYAQTVSEKLAAEKLREILPDALRDAARFEDELRRQAAENGTLDDLRSGAAAIQGRLDMAAQQWYGRQTPKAILDEMERDGIELERTRARIAEEEARTLAGHEADEAVRLLLENPTGVFDGWPWEKRAWVFRLLLANVRLHGTGRGGGRRLTVTSYLNRITGLTVDAEGKSCADGTRFGQDKTCCRGDYRR